ncbi:SDR family oxidoreductase [Clostridium gasigenes]|uniref:SDR family NAD(P)-dependent oxidoreductase n=1 Tax=Clostridium gasigenes TaxID=94869 RepID=UPI001C0ADCFF|nr:SDR family oxidoreductase [Clostridium gasigenes]MBU3089192.1 SDR family oxidoreductase [Clostridium gasigenes]
MKTVTVIGASRGIGLEIAHRMAAKYSRLILTEISGQMSVLLQEAKVIREQYGTEVICYSLDIRDLSNIEFVFKEIEKQKVAINYLICNTGINILCKAIEVTEEIWDEINQVNLKGVFFVIQQVAKNMILNNGGSIVTMGSQHGIQPNYDRAPYCASKAGLINMCKELALEWAAYNIRVNTVSPTYILYDNNKEFLMSPKGQKEYLQSIPLNKYCSAKDVAGAVEFLLSDQAEMITGHNLVVDGGWTIK